MREDAVTVKGKSRVKDCWGEDRKKDSLEGKKGKRGDRSVLIRKKGSYGREREKGMVNWLVQMIT